MLASRDAFVYNGTRRKREESRIAGPEEEDMRNMRKAALIFLALLLFMPFSLAETKTVFFGSDYQYGGGVGGNPDYNFPSLLQVLKRRGFWPDLVALCGDYTNGGANYEGDSLYWIESITYALEEFFPGFTPRTDLLFVQGNHDRNDGDFPPDGLRDYGSFLVYVMNTQTANPFRQGLTYDRSREILTETAARLITDTRALSEAGDFRPLFITTHVPLHESRWTASESGDNLLSRILFDAVSEAARDRTVVYLFGHNHGFHGDSSIGGTATFFAPGEKLAVPDPLPEERSTERYTLETLNFAYMNAGYLGYTDESTGAEARASFGIAEIEEDGRVTLRRHAVDGFMPLGAAGVRTWRVLPEDYLCAERMEYVFPAR